MTDEELRRKIFDIVALQVRRDTASLTAETTLEELRIASLDMVQILFGIEDTFDIYVPQEGQHLRGGTLGEVCERVKALVAAKHASA